MEIRLRDLARTPLGSASFVDLRLPEHENRVGHSVLQDTLAIHVRPRVLRAPAKPGDIQTGTGRLRLNGLAHVGLLQVERAGVLYVAYLNPADEEFLERAKRIRSRGYSWLCMYDLLASFGVTQIGPLHASFMESILEVREEAQAVSPEIFERAADEADWVLKHHEYAEAVLPDELKRFMGTVCTDRTPRAPAGVD